MGSPIVVNKDSKISGISIISHVSLIKDSVVEGPPQRSPQTDTKPASRIGRGLIGGGTSLIEKRKNTGSFNN